MTGFQTVNLVSDFFSNLLSPSKKEDENVFSLLNSLGTTYSTMDDIES